MIFQAPAWTAFVIHNDRPENSLQGYGYTPAVARHFDRPPPQQYGTQ